MPLSKTMHSCFPVRARVSDCVAVRVCHLQECHCNYIQNMLDTLNSRGGHNHRLRLMAVFAP